LPLLFVEGDTALPTRHELDDGRVYLSYAWTRSRDSAQTQLDSVHIGLPVIGSQGTTSLSFVIPLVRRVGSAILSASNGDLGFEIAPISPDSVTFRNQHLWWQLEIPRTCHNNGPMPLLVMHADGAIPQHLSLPRASFAGVSDSTMACLTTASFQEPRLSPYPIAISNSSRIEWRVRIP